MIRLNLNIHKKWFDMIKSGIKREEYRDIKQFYISRLVEECLDKETLIERKSEDGNVVKFKKIDAVTLINGYSRFSPRITFKVDYIKIGKANPEWSNGEDHNFFVIGLGEQILKK